MVGGGTERNGKPPPPRVDDFLTTSKPQLARDRGALAPVAMALEAKMQLKDTSLETAPKTTLVRGLPFAIDNLESDILVWRATLES